jgi:hypothetical protein
MAGQEDTCWRCGVKWGSEETPQTTLRLIPAATPIQAEDVPDRRIAVAATARERPATEVRLNAERWTNKGGSFDFEVAAPRAAVAASR